MICKILIGTVIDTVQLPNTFYKQVPAQTFVSHRWQPEVECFLFWHGFAPYYGQEELLLMTVA